jgi:integrase
VAEWLKALVLKTSVRGTVPWVRIPPCPPWNAKPETARRIRQRIRAVIDWARTAGFYDGVNPIEGIERGLGRQKAKVNHHPAMPWQEVPDLYARLDDAVSASALKFLILTAARTGEVIGATWQEFDLSDALWVIPATRMKADREHRVPLTAEALSILTSVRDLSEDFVFPGQRRGRGLSNMTMAQLLKRMGVTDATVHGFRSSFRDWAEEEGGQPREIAELCLAHEVGNATERAYRRSDLLAKRRLLLEAWTQHVVSKTSKSGRH